MARVTAIDTSRYVARVVARIYATISLPMPIRASITCQPAEVARSIAPRRRQLLDYHFQPSSYHITGAFIVLIFAAMRCAAGATRALISSSAIGFG